MTHLKDFLYLKLTEEEYREILEYVNAILPMTWVKKYDSGEFPLSDEKMNPNTVGILGECALGKYEGKPVTQILMERPVRESDIGWDIVIGGYKYDIKTLQSVIRPNTSYRYNIKKSMIDKKKANDGFIWISMIPPLDRLIVPYYWLVMGWMFKDEFLQKSDFHRKGDNSVTGNDFVYSSDTYDIAVRKLHPYKDLPR
uniref:Uncharacterized protein n=1 Tax=viral metagenome TaxID=1070528 RepID=A0A6M3M9S9_9ZZZZ